MMNRRATHHRRINSDPLGGELKLPEVLDFDEPDLTKLLEFDPNDLFPLGATKSFDEETEKHLLDCGEYSYSPRSRPSSGNFGGLNLENIPSPQVTQHHQLAPPSVPASVPEVPMQIDERPQQPKAAHKKGHRRTASEPFFFGSAFDNLVFEPSHRPPPPPPPPPRQQHHPPPPMPAVIAPPPAPVRRDDDRPRMARPALETIPSARNLPFADESTSLNFDPLSAAYLKVPDKPPPARARPPDKHTNGKKETKTYKCSRCGMIKANHVCRAVLYDSVAVGVQADPTVLIQTYGERTIVVRKSLQTTS